MNDSTQDWTSRITSRSSDLIILLILLHLAIRFVMNEIKFKSKIASEMKLRHLSVIVFLNLKLGLDFYNQSALWYHVVYTVILK